MQILSRARRRSGQGPWPARRWAVRWWRLEAVLQWWPLVRHPAAGGWAKCWALVAVAYLLSPIDLVPDLIPVLGWIDDWVVLGLLARLAQRGLSSGVREDVRLAGARLARQWRRLLIVAAAALLAWVLLATWSMAWLISWLGRTLGGSA
jgi:uncharacterized membrane protein YkvA (DUF1232 family)